MTDRVEIAKKMFAAFAAGDRDYIERHLAEDFTFSAPPDPLLDRAGYFERCWPGAGTGRTAVFTRVVANGDEVIVSYETPAADGGTGCNTEVLTFDGDRVRREEVYFGWTVAPPPNG